MQQSPNQRMSRGIRTLALAVVPAALLAACAPADPGAEPLVLVTHDSFSLSEGVLEGFTDDTGIEVQVQPTGDAGELVNRLVLTKDSPLGDAVFGIDTTFASRAVGEGVLEDYVAPGANPEYALPAGSGGEQLTPIDVGDVCVNIDREWFAENGVAEPTTLEDLADPRYRGLFVTPAANSSSPGLAFLLATIAEYGDDGWQDYWRRLVANDVRVTAGWSDAYYVDFSGPSSEGDRPIVLSYASSPPFEITDASQEPPTAVLLDTCFRQVEYAGVIAGTERAEDAQALVDFLLSPEVQADVPASMYVYPAVEGTPLPDVFAEFASVAEQPYSLDPAAIDAGREEWIEEWSAIAVP